MINFNCIDIVWYLKMLIFLIINFKLAINFIVMFIMILMLLFINRTSFLYTTSQTDLIKSHFFKINLSKIYSLS